VLANRSLSKNEATPINDVVCMCSYHAVWLVVALYLWLSVDPPSIDGESMDKKIQYQLQKLWGS